MGIYKKYIFLLELPKTKNMNWKSARHRRLFWRKNKRKILIPIYLLIFLLMALAIYHNFHSQHRPTSVRRNIKTGVVKTTPTPTPTPVLIKAKPQTPEQFIKSLPYGKLVWQTYGHESTYGQNDGCKSQGLFNGFGFAQSDFGYACFSSLHEVATKVSDWFAMHLQFMTVNQALCYYNTGRQLNNCAYAEYTLAL